MPRVQACDLPAGALLRRYAEQGAYTDCFMVEIDETVSHEAYVEAFYTTAVFKLERLLLRWFVARPSTDGQARALAHAQLNEFAAWHVEARLASKGEGRLEWLIGAAYSESDKTTRDVTYQPGSEAYVDANPGLFGGFPGSLLAPDDNISRYFADQTNEDLGIFGEISYKVTDTVTLTAGGRYFDTKSDSTITRPPSALFPNSFDPVGSSTSSTLPSWPRASRGAAIEATSGSTNAAAETFPVRRSHTRRVIPSEASSAMPSRPASASSATGSCPSVGLAAISKVPPSQISSQSRAAESRSR